MLNSRLRLFSLWISQTARVTADNCLRVWLFFEVAKLGNAQRDSGWHLVTALLMAPAVLLAPFNGALCNALPKPRVLIGSAAFLVLVQGIFLALAATQSANSVPTWLTCWGLVALGAAVYSPTRYALLPAGASDAHMPLPRVNGWFEMGVFAAIVSGMILGGQLREAATEGLPTVVLLSTGLNVLALLTALPVRFASDVRRVERAREAVCGFFRDVGRIVREPEPRWCLAGMAGLRGVITSMAGAFLPALMAKEDAEDVIGKLLTLGVWIMGGVAAGSLLAGLQRHPRRVLGLVPIGALGMTIGLVCAALQSLPSPWLCAFFGVMAGLVNVPLAAAYQADVPADSRGNAMSVRNLADNLCIALMAVLLFTLARGLGWTPAAQLWLVAACAGLMSVFALVALKRELAENVVEAAFAYMYRFRGYGPGLESFPTRGPVLVIANHACYMDPMLLAKFLPRALVPMMTSHFFDKPLLRWMMVHLANAIRVEKDKFRREMPELEEAVAVLDRGRCIVLFPEGRLRRKEEELLMPFGQGVWRILEQRPDTPVAVCWIEGGWGSYFSYKNGPPGRNKHFDFRRPIDIVVGEAKPLPAEILADRQATRVHLMKECLRMRALLGKEASGFHIDETNEPEPTPPVAT
jgi:1-acyl-sn-glycerol-3-phosphate acyltransferase